MNTEPEETTPKKNGKIKLELLFAIMAVAISFLTLFVYIYQSNLMKSQLKMSVWPHLTFGPSINADHFAINLVNNGIGPALIKNVKIDINGNPFEKINEIMTHIPDSLQSYYSFSALWPGQVIMAGENYSLLKINSHETANYLIELIEKNNFKIEICYCSVYNDCWTSYGIEVKEDTCK